MPRYFIDTDDERMLHIDTVGFDFDSDDDARRHALEALPDMARDNIPDGDCRTFVVGVRDENGEMVYRATLTLKGQWCRPRVS